MSVAFRRESDDEHLEPKFELPIPPGPNRVTARGLALTRARVEELEAQLPGITQEDARKKHQRALRYWRTRLATAELAPVPGGKTVEFGCTVRFCLNGKERTITIVGDDEADPSAGLLAFAAPLSRALNGAEEGEMMPFAGKDEAIEVIAITVGS